jgi:hypothetical protein
MIRPAAEARRCDSATGRAGSDGGGPVTSSGGDEAHRVRKGGVTGQRWVAGGRCGGG